MTTAMAKLDVDRKGFDRGLKASTSSLRGFVSNALKIAAPLSAIFGGRAMLEAARTQIQAEKKLAAVLRATGHAAGFSADEIKRFASGLQSVTNFGDEATINAAAVLATFKQIRNDVFLDAIRAAQDMSSVMDTDLRSSVVQLGKALNDPIKGVSALSEVGVSFTEKQREQIKALVKTNDLMGAQKIILAELKSEFGGSAAEMADSLTQVNNKLSDMAEIIGKDLVKSVGWLGENLPGAIDGTAAFVSRRLEEFGVLDPVLTKQQPSAVNPFTGANIGPGAPLRIGDRIDPAALSAGPRDHIERERQRIMSGLQPGLSSLRDFGTAATDLGSRLSGAAKEAIALASVKFDEGFAERVAAMERDAKELFESTRTPAERFQIEKERLAGLFQAGKIDNDLFLRGLNAAMPEAAESLGRARVNRAVERDSSEAFEAMVRATSSPRDDKADRRHEALMHILREQNRLLRENHTKVETW